MTEVFTNAGPDPLHGTERKFTLVLKDVPATWDAHYSPGRGRWVFNYPAKLEGLWPEEAARRDRDAALVEAAPDLLAALKNIMAMGYKVEIWDQADAAIAKAEGETP